MGKKIALAFIALLVLSSGLVAGVVLVRRNQEFRERAAVPSGDATVSISPLTVSTALNTPLISSINFNTNGIVISGVSVRLVYTNSQVTASNIVINPAL